MDTTASATANTAASTPTFCPMGSAPSPSALNSISAIDEYRIAVERLTLRELQLGKSDHRGGQASVVSESKQSGFQPSRIETYGSADDRWQLDRRQSRNLKRKIVTAPSRCRSLQKAWY